MPGVVDGDVDEVLVLKEEADEADGGVDAAQDVVDAELGGEENFFKGGAEEFGIGGGFFGVGEGGPDEVSAQPAMRSQEASVRGWQATWPPTLGARCMSWIG